MITERKYNDVSWFDLETPTVEEVRKLTERTGITLSVADELLSPSQRAKATYYGDHIYLILHFPGTYTYQEDPIRKHANIEIDVVIGKDFIITTRYAQIDTLNEFAKLFEAQSVLSEKKARTVTGGSSYVFYILIHHLYRALYDKVVDVRDDLVEVENGIFSGNEREMVKDLSRLNRIMLGIEESLTFHKEILTSCAEYANEIFHQSFKSHLRLVMHEYEKVNHLLIHNRKYLEELRTTNDSLLTTRQNEIMKNLTVIAFIFLPVSFMASIFGMNLDHIPLVGHENGFFLIVLLMILVTFTITLIFKIKRLI